MSNLGAVAISSTGEPRTGPTAANLAALQAWFLAHDGFLHPSLSFNAASDESFGSHVAIAVDAGTIPPMTTLLNAPYKTSLSVLSIPWIAPFWPLSFLDCFPESPQVITRFALIEAWLQREHGFWWPYLRSLPQPRQQSGRDPFDTPLYWTEDERRWLRGSRLDTAATEREKLWKEEFEKGLKALKEAEISEKDCAQWAAIQPTMWEDYTWPLYLWATTLLTSRSFPSSLLMVYDPIWSVDSNWGKSAIAQALRSRPRSQAPRKFPVLFPGLDLTNHDPRARVRWEVNDDDIRLITHDKLQGCKECFNNYGPKSNDELLVGYGFVIENNEDDTVSFSANTRTGSSQQPQDVLDSNRSIIATSSDTKARQAFESAEHGAQLIRTTHGSPSSPSAVPFEKLAVLSETRALRFIKPDEREVPFNEILRGALSLMQAHNLSMQLANERELKTLQERDNMTDFLPLSPTRNVSLMVDQTIIALRQYLDGIERDMPKENPTTHRQWMAATFWRGQAKVVEGNVECLENWLLSLQKEGYILTLSQILTSEQMSPPRIRLPLRSILEQCCQVKAKAKQVTANSLFEFTFVVWLCLLWFDTAENSRPESDADGVSDRLRQWLRFLKTHYGENPGAESASDQHRLPRDIAQQGPVDVSAERYLMTIKIFAAEPTQEHAVAFQTPRWTQDIIKAAVNVFRQESVAFESMDRLVFNGVREMDEPFLFIEQPDQIW